jgi:hypothetical protein
VVAMHASSKLTVSFHVPEDKALLAALGDVSIRHGHLDHLLKMIIRRFTRATVQDVMDATAGHGSSKLRDRVKSLARREFGEGAALVKVQALMERAARITKRRNAVIHVLCGVDEDGNAVAATEDIANWKSMPTVNDVETLSVDMQKLIDEITAARSMWGFIPRANGKQ